MSLSIQHLNKAFNEKKVLDDISFEVKEGTILGVLGVNGAGKTTLMRSITGIILPDSGIIHWKGNANVHYLKSTIGYLPEERGLYRKMSVNDQLLFFAQLKSINKSEAQNRIDFWLNQFQIKDLKHRVLETLSKGQQQLIQFIVSVIHDPALLILDEPFSGFDPSNAQLILEQMLRLNKELKVTMLYSTHRMETVEGLCDELLFIHRAKKIAHGSPATIRKENAEGLMKLKIQGDIHKLKSNSDIEWIYESNSTATIQVDLKLYNQQFVADLSQHVLLMEATEVLPSMHDIFLKLVRS
jgi:ABC-2 type transport system ATP-binding protein